MRTASAFNSSLYFCFPLISFIPSYRILVSSNSSIGQYKKKIAEWQPPRGKKYFDAKDFFYDEGRQSLICPAGKTLLLN